MTTQGTRAILGTALVLGAAAAALTAAPATAASVESVPGRCLGPTPIRTAATTGGAGKGVCQPFHSTTANCKVQAETVVGPGGEVTNIWYFITDHTINVQGFVSAAYYATDDWLVPHC